MMGFRMDVVTQEVDGVRLSHPITLSISGDDYCRLDFEGRCIFSEDVPAMTSIGDIIEEAMRG